MIPFENMNFDNAVPPGVIKDGAAFVANVVDTEAGGGGAHCLAFLVLLGTIDDPMDVLKVMESDVKTDGTTLGGTPALVHDVVTKPVAANTNGLWLIIIKLTGPHKRYMQLQGTAGDGAAGTYLAAAAMLAFPNQVLANNGCTVKEIAA